LPARNSKMKIGIFADAYLPYKSGVTVSIQTLEEGLRGLGHEVFVFAPDYPGAEKNDHIFRFPSLKSPYPGFRLNIPFSPKIEGIIPKLNLDIIHSQTPFQTGRYALHIKRRFKIPLVYTLHTLFEKYAHYVPLIPEKISAGMISAYIRNFCNNCDHIIVPTDEIKPQLIKNKVVRPITALATGINLKISDSYGGKGIRQKIGIPEDAIVLVFCGRLAKEKNIPFLFNVLKIILKEKPNTYLLVIAGSGPEEENLKTLAKQMGLERNIIFTEGVSHPVVFNYYAIGDIYVFASTTETQGLVIAEAKTKSMPAVVVRAEGVVKSMQDGIDGYLVSLDEKEFANKVIELINHPEKRKEMGRAGRIFVEKEFSQESMAKKMATVYESLRKP
jgi:1,2-diacylglycerol 3-alpha-glucosyltransferase